MKRWMLSAAAFLVVLVSARDAAAGRPCLARPADVIYHNGTVQTLDRRFSSGEAIALLRGRVLWVGPSRVVLTLFRGCGTKVVDLQGKTVLPGFVDPHTHAFASTFWGREPADDVEMLAWLRETQEAQLAVGYTTQAEALGSPTVVERIAAFAASGDLHIRTTVYQSLTDNCKNVLDFTAGSAPDADLDGRPRTPGLKIFADGAGNNPCGYRAATTFEHHGHEEPFFGDLLFDQSTMDGLVQGADAGGWQILVHSIGDRSRDQVVGSYSTVLAGDGANPRRHRIEHNNYMRADQIAAYAAYGIVPVVFGYNFTCHLNAGLDPIYEGLPDKSWYRPYRTMLAAGLRVAIHGDYTAAEVLADPDRNNWMGGILSSLVTRKEFYPGETCLPSPAMAAETVTVKQALRMLSRNAAYAIGMEDVTGSLEPGKYADLVIVSHDPLATDPDLLHQMRVLVTVIGGVPRWCSPTAGMLCL